MFIILQIFLKIGGYSWISPSFSWGIRPCDVFRPIAHKQKDLMDYNVGYQVSHLIFNNYPAKLHGILSDTKLTRPTASSAKIRRYSATLSRIIVLLFNKLITKLVTFLNLSVDIFSLHLFFPRTKLHILPDICYLRMTDIESIMTIFG